MPERLFDSEVLRRAVHEQYRDAALNRRLIFSSKRGGVARSTS
jgi:hypothetical protein